MSLVDGNGLFGLLGLAFHPDHPANGLLYVYYIDLDGSSVVTEHRVSPGSRRRTIPPGNRTVPGEAA